MSREYTGVKDKNMKEIYEGDIIRFEWCDDSCWGKAGTYEGYIRFIDGEFRVIYMRGGEAAKNINGRYGELSSFVNWSEEIEVIGNVYDDIELLQKGEEMWVIDLTGDDETWITKGEAYGREEAIKLGAEIAKEQSKKCFWIGRRIKATIPRIEYEDIQERLTEQIADEYDRPGEDYLVYVTGEQEEELENKINELIVEWHEKYNLEPTCYSVEDIEKIIVEEE